MTERTAYLDGVAFWAPGLPGWDLARDAFQFDGAAAPSPLARRPAPTLLPPAERRRAPDTVALALEVATHAVEASGQAPADLCSVFASAHGDLAITDYVCATLATTPLAISPTKFHNSVHNAASGYWGIATGCLQASTALSALDASFAAGLLEALTQCAAEQRPVLLVAYDIEAVGALASTNDSRGSLAIALVLAPERSVRSQWRIDWALDPGLAALPALRSAAARDLACNAMHDALPFAEALARGETESLTLPLALRAALRLRIDRSA